MADIAAAPARALSARPRVLVVDDDADLLEAIAVQFAQLYDLITAPSGKAGLSRLVSDGPFAVVVSDMEMEGMNGIEFLREVNRVAPLSMRVMMTAHRDIEIAAGAVNDGHIFRFLPKPFKGIEIANVLGQSCNQYQLVTAERELLERTLVNSIQMLVDILALVSPLGFGRANRIRAYAKQIADILLFDSTWEVELAGLLCQIGCITIPPVTLAKILSGDNLTSDEEQSYGRLPEISSGLIDHIPRLERVARIIARPQGSDAAIIASGEPVGTNFEADVAAILRAAMQFDSLISRGCTKSRALAEMQKRKGEYSLEVLRALSGVDAISADRRMTVVKSNDLNSTMVIRENLYAKNRHLVVGKNQQVTKSMRELIRSYVQRGILDDSISVYLPAESDQIKVTDIIPDCLTSAKA